MPEDEFSHRRSAYVSMAHEYDVHSADSIRKGGGGQSPRLDYDQSTGGVSFHSGYYTKEESYEKGKKQTIHGSRIILTLIAATACLQSEDQ